MGDERLVDLDKQIEQQLIIWKKDQYFKKLPKDIQRKVKQFLEYFSFVRNSDGTLPLFDTEQKDDPKKANFKKFLYFYHKMYKEICGMDCIEQMNGAHIKIHQAQVNNIIEQGIDIEMYLDWIFHDFLSQKINQKFMPPTIKFVLGTFMFGKFLYANKDEIEKKKKENLLFNQKQKLNDILIAIYQETKIPEFGVIVRKVTANEMTISKAISESKQLCTSHDCMNYITKLQEIKQLKS